MKRIIPFIIYGSLLFISCKKEKTQTGAPVTTGFKKVKEVASYLNGTLQNTSIYTYDELGRIASVTGNQNVDLFEYIGNNEMKVTAKSKTTGQIKWIETAKLNNKGAITEIIKRKPSGVVMEGYYYQYDANGYMISYKYISPLYNNDVSERFFVIDKGIIVSAKAYFNGVHQQDFTHEFETNELSPVPFTPDFNWISETLYGTPIKHPRKLYKATKVPGGELTFHALYSQKNTASGLEETRQYPLNGTTGTLKYTF